VSEAYYIFFNLLAGMAGGFFNYVQFHVDGNTYVKLRTAIIRIIMSGPFGWFVGLFLSAIISAFFDKNVFENIKYIDYALSGVGGAVAPLLLAGGPDVLRYGWRGAVEKWSKDRNGKEK
jgi:hypothetical protein